MVRKLTDINITIIKNNLIVTSSHNKKMIINIIKNVITQKATKEIVTKNQINQSIAPTST